MWDHITNRPVEPTDRFYIASVTKTFIGALVLGLVDDNQVRLEDTINRYGVDFGPTGDQITVRDLLAHTSGIPAPTGAPPASPAEQIADVRNKPLLYPPETRTTYSNI